VVSFAQTRRKQQDAIVVALDVIEAAVTPPRHPIPSRVRFGLRLCLARAPKEEQVKPLVELYQKELAHYRGNEADARKLATDPLGPLPTDVNAAEAAAWTSVANVLLNLDGVLAKG